LLVIRPALLDTQLAALEPPPDALTIDAGAPVTTLLDAIGRGLLTANGYCYKK
jgi:hypothetical protein